MKTVWTRLNSQQKFYVFFALVFVARFIFSYFIPLIDDEAYHWTWTQQLQLSYFDHPGMVAWVESLSLLVFGNTYIGVRMSFLLFYMGTVFFLWKLTRDLFGENEAYVAALLMLFSPVFGLGGYVASPEPPFIFFWVLGAWVFWQGVREDQQKWSLKKTWVSLGFIMGLGLNSKFIIALLAFGFGIYLLISPKNRKDLFSPWPWIGFLIATIVASPIFIWNIQKGWPGFIYQFSDRHTRDELSIWRWFGFLGTQFGLYTPVIYGMSLIALVLGWTRRAQAAWRFLFALSIPSFIVFFPQPLKAEYKPHWSGTALLMLSMGVAALWVQGLNVGTKQIIAPKSKRVLWGVLAFFIPINFIFYTGLAYPWIPKFYKLYKPAETWNTSWDFTNEFYGWEEFGQYVNRRQRELHAETGRRPFLASQRYETTAQLTWGTKQKVFELNDSISQYTVQQTPLELEALKGMDTIFVTSEKYKTNPLKWAKWDSCALEEFKTYRHDEHARTFALFVCKNFQGINQR